MVSETLITAELGGLGLVHGETILVHASLRNLGWVSGGARTVVAALRNAVGTEGTLVAPAFTSANSMTSRAHLNRVCQLSPSEADAYRTTMPPFDPRTSASDMGRIAERLRRTRGALRSTHPTTSFTALGPQAARVVTGHDVDCLLGERSPLARLYELGARILLLGVGFEVCTAFHLAEYRQSDPPRYAYSFRVASDGLPTWRNVIDIDLDDSDFTAIGEHLEDGTVPVLRGRVGRSTARLMPLDSAVDAAAQWMTLHRPASRGMESSPT